MADLVVTLGVPHTPLLWGAMATAIPTDLAEVAATYERFRRLLDDARPDVLVMVGSDHLRSVLTANMPAFLVGKSERLRGTVPSEERAFGLPTVTVSGHPDLGREVLGRHQLTSRFDFAFSDELWLDHSFVVPLLYLRPQLDLPVVPIHTNTNAPPLPRPERFLDLGRYLREVVEGWKESARVAVICSGHMAFELGGPRQFMPPSPDPSFDRAALQALSDRDTAGLVELCSYQRMLDAGNLTFQFLNFLVGHGITEGIAPITAATVPSRFGDEPFFAWTGSEQTR